MGSVHKIAPISDKTWDSQALHTSDQLATNLGIPTIPSGLIH